MHLKSCVFFMLIIVYYAITSKAQASVRIKGQVTYTEDYCNGARPSDELLQDLASPKPLAHKWIYVKIGTQNKYSNRLVQKIKTDAKGQFTLNLKAGQEYYIVEEWKAKPFVAPKNTQFVQWDILCLKKQYAQPDYSFTLHKNRPEKIVINYHKTCTHAPYCGQYSGPLPP